MRGNTTLLQPSFLNLGNSTSASPNIPLAIQSASDCEIDLIQSTTGVTTYLFASGTAGAGAKSNHAFYLATNNTTRFQVTAAGVFAPFADDTYAIGTSALRATTVHARSITIGQSLANPTMGVVTLSGSGVAIAYTSAFTSGARVFLTHQNAAGTTGTARVTASTAGVGFTITSSSATDTSTIGWWVVPVS